MKILFEMPATRKQYKYNTFNGWTLKEADERRKGTPTLAVTRLTAGTSNYWFNDGDFKYHCMHCGWEFTAKNTYNRVGNSDIECPNCGFSHKSFNTILTKTDGDELIPIDWTLKIYQLGKFKIIFSFTYNYQYNPYDKHNPENTEKFIFDLKENSAVWEKWKNRSWHKDAYGRYVSDGVNVLQEQLNIGYTDDCKEMHRRSVFANLKPHYNDDNDKTLSDAIETLKNIIMDIRTKLQGFSKQRLSISGRNPESILLDSLLNIAHKVRFWESPHLSFLGTKAPDISSWFANNWLDYTCNIKAEREIEKIIRETNKNFYDAAREYFNIPDNPDLKAHFSYRNIGLYKELERRYQNNKIVNLLFKHFHRLPGQCVKESTSYYSKSTKSSSIMLCLDIFEKHSKKIMELTDKGISEMLDKIQHTVRNIATLDPKYKSFLNDSRRYYGTGIDEYIIKFVSKMLDEAIFEYKVRTEAEAERKNYYQKLAETLQVPNTPHFRKYYRFEYISQIRTVFSKYGANIANEFMKVFNEAYEEYHNHTPKYIGEKRINGIRRYISSIYKKDLPEFLDVFISFYDTFHPLFPKIVTPAYTARFVKNEDNYASDCLSMYEKFNEESKAEFIRNKPRMKDLHNYLCKLTNLQEYPDINFDIPENVVNRFEMYCKNSKLKVLKKYSELLEIGNLLNNCTATYRDKISKDNLLAVITDDIGKPIAEIEIKDNEIYQAKLMNNRKVRDNPEINAEIIRFAQKTKLRINTTDISLETKENTAPADNNTEAA